MVITRGSVNYDVCLVKECKAMWSTLQLLLHLTMLSSHYVVVKVMVNLQKNSNLATRHVNTMPVQRKLAIAVSCSLILIL